MKAAELPAVSVAAHGDGQCAQPHGAVVFKTLSEQDKSRAGCEHGHAFLYALLQGRKKAEILQKLALDRTLSPGQHKAVKIPLQIAGLTNLETLHADIRKRVLVLDKRALKGQNSNLH